MVCLSMLKYKYPSTRPMSVIDNLKMNVIVIVIDNFKFKVIVIVVVIGSKVMQ